MYSQSIIDSYDEKTLEKTFYGEQILKIDAKDNRSVYLRFYYAFQHYLIKAFSNGYNRDLCLKYIRKYYNDFGEYPYLFCDSPLLNDQTLDLFFGNSPQKDKIKEFKNNYYSNARLKELYDKRNSSGLTLEESNQYYARLVPLINSGNKSDQEFLTKEIENIINTEFSNLTDMQLKFYCQYVSKYALGNRNIKTVVKIGTNEPSNRGYNCNSYIFINKNAFQSIELLTKTVCHETRHAVQREESRGQSTLSAFEQAQNQLFCKYLNTKEYDSYHKNYRYSGIEIDAEMVGHSSASVFFTMFHKQELAEKVRENRRQTTDERNNYNLMIDNDNRAHNTDEFIVTNMDNIIMNNKEELEQFPVLKSIYNSDGTRKPITELMTAKMHETIDNRGIFDNYIRYEITNNKLDSIPINNINQDTMKRYIESLGYLYRDIAIELNDYLHDDRNAHNPNQEVFVTKYKVLLSFKLLKYINENYDIIMNNLNSTEFNNLNPIFTFIYYLRDFDINSIKNAAVKNDPELMSNIETIKELSNTIILKFNRSYVDSKLDKMAKEVLESMVDVPNIGSVGFEEFFKNYILPNMDGHKNVIINNQKFYVGDLLATMAKETTYSTGVGR